MGLSVLFVSGLKGAGKSALIRGTLDRLWKIQPHYIRLVDVDSNQSPAEGATGWIPPADFASERRLDYDADHIFEILPEALTAIHRQDRYGAVIIEADADPALRHAYPYDHRVFVMPLPEAISDVFRDPASAADELQRALDDTAAFASEIFGLFDQPECSDTEPSEERADLTGQQMRGFLYSPLGDELATRIQLQPAYHGLVESDVVVVNTGIGQSRPETAGCLRRIERLLNRIRGVSGRRGDLFLCDPRNQDGKSCKKLFKTLKPMCQGGK